MGTVQHRPVMSKTNHMEPEHQASDPHGDKPVVTGTFN